MLDIESIESIRTNWQVHCIPLETPLSSDVSLNDSSGNHCERISHNGMLTHQVLQIFRDQILRSITLSQGVILTLQ